jgi:hypothetical protein
LRSIQATISNALFQKTKLDPSYFGGRGKRIPVQHQPGKKQELYLKNKDTGGVVQVPSKMMPSSSKKK